MPKRSNAFQRIVRAAFEQMAAEGVTVEESALVPEREHPHTRREVDLLVEQRVAGIAVRMAVEVRARGRRDDVEWIDGILGKYSDLDVDLKVAVSRSGFTDAAQRKAAAKGVRTMTLVEVRDADWLAQFARLGVAHVVWTPRLRRWELQTAGAPSSLTEHTVLTDEAGAGLCTVRDLVLSAAHGLKARLPEMIKQRLVPELRVVADLDRKHVLEVTRVPPEAVFVPAETGRVPVTALVLKYEIETTRRAIAQRVFRLHEAKVGVHNLAGVGGVVHSVATVQTADRPSEARIVFERRDVDGDAKPTAKHP